MKIMNDLEILLQEIEDLEGPDQISTLVGITAERAQMLSTVAPDEWEYAYEGEKSLPWCQELNKALIVNGPQTLDGLELPFGPKLKILPLEESTGPAVQILELEPSDS